MDKIKHIIWITGASGVGKTTLLSSLKEKYSKKNNWEFIKFDSIGIPPTKDMIKQYGSTENWQLAKTEEWIGKMVNGYAGKEVIIMDGQANLKFIKTGFEKQNFNNYQIVLLDCEESVMIKRLIDIRQQEWLADEDMKNWLRFLRKQAQDFSSPIIETSHIAPSQVEEKFENILKHELTKMSR